MAWKQKPDKGDNQTVKHYEAGGAPKRTVGQAEKTFDAPGNAHKRAHRCAITGIQKFERQRESQIGNERKRMRRIDRKRRQNREHVQEEIVLQPLSFSACQIADVEDYNAVGGEFGLQGLPPRLLGSDQLGDTLANAFELLRGSAPIIRNFRDASKHLTNQPRHANH